MFYYISFLRPPPHASLSNAPIKFTPQISNDLRTESYPGSLDIFYHWGVPTSTGVSRLTEPTKLTTWRQANAYKELTIPPPLKRVQAVLVLSSDRASTVDLTDPSVGSVPLPVSSLPIRFGAGNVAKQEAIERSFRVLPGEDAPLLTVKEMTSFDLDKKLWDSGIGLSAWLTRLRASKPDDPQQQLVSELKTLLIDAQNCDVVELGAGTGMVSLVLAALRASSINDAELERKTRILSTDLPSSIELMELNIQMNTALFPDAAPSVLALDWDEALPSAVHDIGTFDLIVMADVTYNTSSFPSLLRTLSSILALSSSRHPLVLLAYKERDPAERELWDLLARETGIILERVGSQAGAGGQEVEIWMGRRSKPT
ncbi:hypothetical protein BV25DRAFT_1920310 [Artomyces pyxidatus]|uniref:Uncharacterized protein n=1 Tax=Artomyces pyxidatus TaxID=48021 RepID=A0ACB8SLY1_9AGAM|nr:hypothetical protein BV25DRAFT_1920310 [Artomyces pyxidatus]